MKKTIITLIGFLTILGTALPVGAVTIYEHDFNSGNLDDWTHIITQNPYGETGEWSIEDDVLQFTRDPLTPQAGSLRLDTLLMPESFILEFDARSVEIGPGASHMAFYTHWRAWTYWIGHGYQPGRFYIASSGDFYRRYNPHSDADPYEWHHFRYIEEGTAATLYYDDDLIYSTNLTAPFTDGYLVLWANPGIHQYDNLLITDMDGATPIPEPTTLYLLGSGLMGLAGLRRKLKR